MCKSVVRQTHLNPERDALAKQTHLNPQGLSPGKVFLCYRREDSGGYAIGIQERLKRDLGADVLFMDIDSIPFGKNFVKILDHEVAKCVVLLAVIGQNWLDARDEDGKRRLDNPNDFVRIEIAAALRPDIPVIPILLNGVRIPSANMLPGELGELSVRHGIDVRHSSFPSDVERLVRGVQALLNELTHNKTCNLKTNSLVRTYFASMLRLTGDDSQGLGAALNESF